MSEHRGKSRHRLANNPLERAFADAWEEANRTGNILAYLKGNGTDRGYFSPSEAEVCATVIQWLGSPVGQCFIRDVLIKPEAADIRRWVIRFASEGAAKEGER